MSGAMLRDIIKRDSLPDYRLTEEPGDRIIVMRKGAVIEESLTLRPETLEKGRSLMPGADIYALEAEWRSFAATRPPRCGLPGVASKARCFPAIKGVKNPGWPYVMLTTPL